MQRKSAAIPIPSPSNTRNLSLFLAHPASLFAPTPQEVSPPRAIRRLSVPAFEIVDEFYGCSAPIELTLQKKMSDPVKQVRRSERFSNTARSLSVERCTRNSSLLRGTFELNINSAYGIFPVVCHSWNCISELKDMVIAQLHKILPVDTEIFAEIPISQDLDSSMIRLFSAGKELKNSSTLFEEKISRESSVYATLCAKQIFTHVTPSIQAWGEFINDGFGSERLVAECSGGFRSGYEPQLVSEGTGGTYFLKSDCGQTVAVFKPDDEEPKAPNNPRGYQGSMHQPSLRKGILSGEAALREVAAYLLDHDSFSNVPMTTRVEALHDAFCYFVGPKVPKAGSLQEFVEFDEMACDLAPQIFSVDQVHKIGILDIRLVNTDRNDANILVKNVGSTVKLIPVDHGFCLPDHLEIAWCDWCWLDWPQSKVHFSPETLQYIREQDVKADIEILRTKLSIREEPLKIMEICHTVLLRGAEAGLTLYEIGKIISRDKIDAPSLLEITMYQASSLASSAKMKLRQPNALVRSSSMFMQCSKCMSLLSSSSGECQTCIDKQNCSEDPLALADSPNGPQQRQNRQLGELDELFWRYFDILLHQVISTRTMRSRRRNSYAGYVHM